MKILVLNCGSSSIKYQVIDMKSADDYTLLVKGIVERIGLSDAILTHKPTGKSKYEIVKSIPDHTSGISLILDALVDPEHGVLESISEIAAVSYTHLFPPRSCFSRKSRCCFRAARCRLPVASSCCTAGPVRGGCGGRLLRTGSTTCLGNAPCGVPARCRGAARRYRPPASGTRFGSRPSV